ncbi:CHAP domain-containing protein [bacterium CPR1]|nr:CHAP domain-containing protein [bacterium CPR1]
MRILVTICLAAALTGGAAAQGPCGPCGPCGPSGPSGGVTTPGPMIGPGDRSMNDGDRDSAPGSRIRSDTDLDQYIRDEYGGDYTRARKDPLVQDYFRGLKGEDRYILQDRLSANHDHSSPKDPNMQRITGTATNDYYCHDFAWRQGDKSPPVGGHLDPNPILADPGTYGYTRVTTPQAGDIVIYHQTSTSTADHSGLVIRVSDGNVHMISKDVGNSLFRHTLDSPNNYFRGAYGAQGITILRPGPYAVPPGPAGSPPKPAVSGP